MEIDSPPQLNLEIPEISQIGFVVEDIDDGMKRFGRLLGVGPWEVYRFEPPRLTETTFRGVEHDYSMTIAVTDLTGTMIELIEPLEGESIYTEHLAEHGEGLHHVACFTFENVEEVIREFKDAGMGVLQSGNFNGTKYWYFDTVEDLNGIIFQTGANLDKLQDPDRIYPN